MYYLHHFILLVTTLLAPRGGKKSLTVLEKAIKKFQKKKICLERHRSFLMRGPWAGDLLHAVTPNLHLIAETTQPTDHTCNWNPCGAASLFPTSRSNAPFILDCNLNVPKLKWTVSNGCQKHIYKWSSKLLMVFNRNYRKHYDWNDDSWLANAILHSSVTCRPHNVKIQCIWN